MDNLLIRRRMSLPVTTGIPTEAPKVQPQGVQTQPNVSFRQVLEQTAQKQELSFSKHATQRVAQRGIELSETGMERLNEGLQIVRDKGMDGSAFIVNAKNGMVITALNSGELKGRVITNIDGTVIL